MHRPRPVIIDTDPGIDDAMAILYALASPELDVLGLTTVFGNAPVDVCTANALDLAELAGRHELPIAAGAAGPLVGRFDSPADFVHGPHGRGDLGPATPIGAPADLDAADFIVREVTARPGEVTLLAIGPLTNVAHALARHRGLDDELAGIVVMGGNAFCGGNASPAAEANILNDPEAADRVFGARCPVVMVGLDVTESVVMSTADLASIHDLPGTAAAHLAAILPFYQRFYRDRLGLDGIHVHDSTAVSYLLAPERFSWREHPIRVDTGASVCRGKTLPALSVSDHEEAWADRRPVRILTGVDSRAVVRLELDRLSTGR